MTFQMLIQGSAATPSTRERDEPEHRCGRCNSPFGRNPECPNRPVPIAGVRVNFDEEN